MTTASLDAGQETQMAILALLARAEMSRATIARELDLSSATVTHITRKLIKQGLIRPLSFSPSDGGRPGQLLGLVGGAGYAIGVKLAADHLVLVDVRLDGKVRASKEQAFDARARDAKENLRQSLEAMSHQGSGRLLGIGIGVPGIITDPDLGIVDSAILGWSQHSLGAYLRETMQVPVLIENDVNALAIAEHVYGSAQNISNFAVLTVGSGVGFAHFTHGSLSRGSHGAAGEIGHILIENDGRKCYCGKCGCLEGYIGEAGLVQTARNLGTLTSSQGIDVLIDKADHGHDGARVVFHDAGRLLASVVAPILTILDPDVLIIAGEGTRAWSHWDDAFRDALLESVPTPLTRTSIVVEASGEPNWAHGAAAIVLATPFDPNSVAGFQRTAVLARLHITEDA